MRTRAAIWAGLVTWLAAMPALAQQVHSNGVGGGSWSDPVTWRGGAAPGPGDVAVISKGDRVVIDSGDADQPLCAGLVLDPESALVIKPALASPHVVLRIAGGIDCYGIVQADLTNFPESKLELCLTGEGDDDRKLLIRTGGALVLHGSDTLADDQRNILIASAPDGTDEPPRHVHVEASDGSMLDLRMVELRHCLLTATGIDNTGYAARQRINITNNRLLGESRLLIDSCDTPLIADNTLIVKDRWRATAIHIRGGTMATIRNNTITGPFDNGIYMQGGADGRIIDNTITGPSVGLNFYNNSTAGYGNTVTGCSVGININRADLTLESSAIEDCVTPFQMAHGAAQFTSVRFARDGPESRLMRIAHGRITLVNCTIDPARVQVDAPPPDNAPVIESFAYLVVKAAGSFDRATRVHVRTEGAPEDKPDLNVRHAPASLRADGFTPLPRTRGALELRSWTLAGDGKIIPPPTYVLSVVDPPAEEGGKPRVRLTRKITPDDTWFRPQPDALEPTIEVTLP